MVQVVSTSIKQNLPVRITHLPTGTVVASQAQRSQLKNREQAMGMLKAKLYQLEVEKKEQEAAALRGEQKEIGWGSQIVLMFSIHILW